jgi:hypothetical protein
MPLLEVRGPKWDREQEFKLGRCHFAIGCHLNRPIAKMIEGAGFRVERLETGYAPGPRPITFFYEGSARAG